MERISQIIDYLSDEDLITINHYMILRYGGHYAHISKNILNPDSFYYVLEVVKAEIFGRELYESLYRKAAAYAFLIIKDHIFYDGNKRTGCESAFIFLYNNGVKINASIEKIIELGRNIENGSFIFDEIDRWLQSNSQKTE